MPRATKALQTVLEECQKFAGQLPLERRANLYRGLAEVCANTQKRADYLSLAEECDALRRHEAQVQFNLLLEGDGE